MNGQKGATPLAEAWTAYERRLRADRWVWRAVVCVEIAVVGVIAWALWG